MSMSIASLNQGSKADFAIEELLLITQLLVAGKFDSRLHPHFPFRDYRPHDAISLEGTNPAQSYLLVEGIVGQFRAREVVTDKAIQQLSLEFGLNPSSLKGYGQFLRIYHANDLLCQQPPGQPLSTSMVALSRCKVMLLTRTAWRTLTDMVHKKRLKLHQYLNTANTQQLYHKTRHSEVSLAFLLQEMAFTKGVELVRQGAVPTHIYLVTQGSCLVSLTDQKKVEAGRVEVGQGQLIGLVEVMKGIPSEFTVTVKSLQMRTCLISRKQFFLHGLAESSAICALFESQLHKYKLRKSIFAKTELKKELRQEVSSCGSLPNLIVKKRVQQRWLKMKIVKVNVGELRQVSQNKYSKVNYLKEGKQQMLDTLYRRARQIYDTVKMEPMETVYGEGWKPRLHISSRFAKGWLREVPLTRNQFQARKAGQSSSGLVILDDL